MHTRRKKVLKVEMHIYVYVRMAVEKETHEYCRGSLLAVIGSCYPNRLSKDKPLLSSRPFLLFPS